MNKKGRNKMNKRGISVMIGYVLLVTAAIVMSIIVYQWMKSYVPSESPFCPEDVSVFMTDYSCDSTYNFLNITLKNNGKFSVAGYFIHVAGTPDQEIATTDVSPYITQGGTGAGGSVMFVAGGINTMRPNDEKIGGFKLNTIDSNKLYSIEIIPARYQEIDDKLTFVSCGNAKIKEEITCDLGCVDSDGGMDIYVVGTCMDSSIDCSSEVGGCTDFCPTGTSNSQKEYYCSAGSCVTDSTGCPRVGDWTCDAGACVPTPP